MLILRKCVNLSVPTVRRPNARLRRVCPPLNPVRPCPAALLPELALARTLARPRRTRYAWCRSRFQVGKLPGMRLPLPMLRPTNPCKTAAVMAPFWPWFSAPRRPGCPRKRLPPPPTLRLSRCAPRPRPSNSPSRQLQKKITSARWICSASTNYAQAPAPAPTAPIPSTTTSPKPTSTPTCPIRLS